MRKKDGGEEMGISWASEGNTLDGLSCISNGQAVNCTWPQASVSCGNYDSRGHWTVAACKFYEGNKGYNKYFGHHW